MYALRIVLIVLALGFVPAASAGPTLTGLDGKPATLDEFLKNGKWTVVGVWGPRCGYCHAEMPEREQLHRRRNDINMVGVALDHLTNGYAKPAEVRDFVRQHKLSYPILLSDSSIVAALGGGDFIGTPTTLIFDRQGRLVARQPGRVSNKVIEAYIDRAEGGNDK